MNNSKADRDILISDGSVSFDVKLRLENILDVLKKGRVPDIDIILGLEKSFHLYLEECSNIDTLDADEESAEPAESFEDKVNFSDIPYDDSIEFLFGTDVLLDSVGIQMIKQFVMKKLLTSNTLKDAKMSVDYLIEKKIIMPVSIQIEESDNSYYCMTTNAWRCIQKNYNMDYLQAYDSSFIIAENMCMCPQDWNHSTFIKAAMINRYYESRGISNYFIFSDFNNSQMLMGCEIKDRYAVEYCCPLIEHDSSGTSEVERLYEILKKSELDNLTTIVQTNEMKKELERTQGLTEERVQKLSYYVLSEGM